MILIAVALALFYSILVLAFTSGWRRLPVFWPKDHSNIHFSVIIPVRNEEEHILQLLISLRKQHYPKNQYEVIVVDDHSTDATSSIIERKILSGFLRNVRLIKATDLNSGRGKKHALAAGIAQAGHEWIITTDADCIAGSHWLQSLAGFIEVENPSMIIGPVSIAPGKTLFSQMQALEFMSLTGSTAGAAAIGKPVMCNGANLAFRKNLFEKVGGYKGNEQLSSGDDIFLLHKFKKIPQAKITFLKSHGASILTSPMVSMRDLFLQRGRWAGKALSYKDGFTIITGAVVGLLNVGIALGLIAGLFVSQTLMLFSLLLLVFKALVDLPLLLSVSAYYQRRELMWLYPALALVYPFYVTTSLFSGFLLKSGWKK